MKQIFTFFLITIIINCTPERGCPYELYYRLPTTIDPVKTEYKTGDTIWIETSFPKIIKDETANILNDFSGYSFGEMVRFYQRIDSNFLYNGSAQNFKYDQVLGKTEIRAWSKGEFHVMHFTEKNDSLFYRAGIIPKAKGLYITFVGNLFSSNEMDDLPECSRSRVKIETIVNNESENGFSLLSQNKDTLDKYDKWSKTVFDSVGAFVFRVN